MPEKVVAVEAWVTKSWWRLGEMHTEDAPKNEVLEIRVFETEPALLRRGYGLTINLQNYESARVDVGVTVPCYREEISEVDDWAKRFCEDRIQAEIADIRSSVKQS